MKKLKIKKVDKLKQKVKKVEKLLQKNIDYFNSLNIDNISIHKRINNLYTKCNSVDISEEENCLIIQFNEDVTVLFMKKGYNKLTKKEKEDLQDSYGIEKLHKIKYKEVIEKIDYRIEYYQEYLKSEIEQDSFYDV